MKTTIIAGALALAVSFGGPAFAQQDLNIGGVAVPAGELEAVQMKCEELFANRATALAQPTAATPGAEAPAAGASADAGAMESTAEAPVNPVSPAEQQTAEGGNMAAQPLPDATAPATTPAVIDIASLTADLCDEGGFTPEMD